jgi:pimeloyl-ACP methyl ester carboxylesterase
VQVVLIHGAGATVISWTTVIHKIPRHFVLPTYNIHDSFQSIMSSVQPLIDPNEKTVVIGHSFGGIVAYHLAKANPNVIAGMSIATPWGGSVVAQVSTMFWNNQFCKNVGRYEPHMKQVRTVPVEVPWINIITTRGLFSGEYDGVVAVSSQKEMCPTDKIENIELKFSHNEVLHCQKLSDEIVKFLSRQE